MENQAQERKNRLALAHEGSQGDGRWMGWLGYGIYIYDYVLPYYFLTKSSLLNVEADL